MQMEMYVPSENRESSKYEVMLKNVNGGYFLWVRTKVSYKDILKKADDLYRREHSIMQMEMMQEQSRTQSR